MKRKFSLFVTIVVCLLIAVGILSACNDDSEQDPGAHVHSMELTAAKEATCTEGGNNAYYHCSGCNRYFKDEAGTQETTVEAEVISATGHNWDNGEITTAATCTEEGVMTFTCSNCNKTRTETIPATGHNWNDGDNWNDGEVTAEATCTTDGVMTYTCLDCGETRTETIPATGHNWNDGEVTTAATCTTDGVMTYTCLDCAETKIETIPALGHGTTIIEANAATCTEAGNNAYYHCSRCDKYFKDLEGEEVTTVEAETIPATGHDWNGGEITTAATCTTDGFMTYTCLDCGETKTETIAAAGHDYEETVIAPTCTEKGYTLYECRNCDDSYTDNEVAALGHSMTLTEANAATCTEEGNNAYYHCSRCDKYFKDLEGEEETTVEAETIPATGHNWNGGEITTEATCTTDGVMTYTCLDCGETKTETIAATGHNYVNGECVKCGATEPGYGDEEVYTRVDEDGNESATGDYILFGSYPQTKVTDASIISALGEFDESTWASYGYYISGQVSDHMYYIDKEYNGEKYRGVYFTSYRPNSCGNSSSASNSYQDDNGYVTSTVYWFKYEPIKWLIVEESNGKATLVADLILDSQQYDPAGSNNYAESTIRAWLNETFYNTAFNELQQSIIQTVEVDNSAASTGYSSNQYACENTTDKIFLMSYVEATTWFTRNSAREKQGSDYAKSQGLWVSTSSSFLGNGLYWLRSPRSDSGSGARVVGSDGIFKYYSVRNTFIGVLPALVIELDESEEHIHTMETISATEATCTEEGNNEYYYCSECGKYFAEGLILDWRISTPKDHIIPVTEHDWDNGEVATAATCTTDGEKIYTCLSCGETKTEIIPAGHNYVNGECVNCGATEPIYTRVDEEGNESATGDYILFGSYPQSKVTDASIISALGEFDESTWTSYGYYIGGQVSHYMYYIDKEYNGEKYRGVYFTSYRPDSCGNSSSTLNSYQDNNGYATSTVYWFKYEPIKWLIAEESDGKATLVADLILDSQQYDYEDGSYSKNYAESTIRAWLNETFYSMNYSNRSFRQSR